MKTLVITLLIACSCIAASAQDADKVKELELRLQKLEERMSKMENRQQTPEVKKMRKIAREHEDVERKNFKSGDIAKAEELYQKASKILPTSGSEAKKLLDSVVTTYPLLNRAGCAQLYRAQQDTAQEKERLLKDCIARFSTCYYLDGTQVGPLATFELALYYSETGRAHDARKLFKRLRDESPEAVGHDGELLVDKIK